MRPRLFSSLLILITLLASCTSPTPAPTATATLVPTGEPSATTAPAATPQTRSTPSRPAATYPARPTATPFAASDEIEEGVYVDGDNGVTVRYPAGWMAVPPDPGSGLLQYFVAPGGAVFGALIADPAGSQRWTPMRRKCVMRS